MPVLQEVRVICDYCAKEIVTPAQGDSRLRRYSQLTVTGAQYIFCRPRCLVEFAEVILAQEKGQKFVVPPSGVIPSLPKDEPQQPQSPQPAPDTTPSDEAQKVPVTSGGAA